MNESSLLEHVATILAPLGSVRQPGEEYERPRLDVLEYHVRAVRWSWVPIVGRATSVVAIVRHPDDLGPGPKGARALLDRLARAANGRFTPWGWPGGLTIALTALVVSPTPIRPDEEAELQDCLMGIGHARTVPLGLFRICLEQEAFTFAIREGPGGHFPEPVLLAEGLSTVLGRFVAPFEG